MDDLRDKRTAPTGLVPKNIQNLILVGLATVMVLAIVISGGNEPRTRQEPVLPMPVAVDPRMERIEQYKQEIEEETRKLSEEAALARQEANRQEWARQGNAGHDAFPHDSTVAPAGVPDWIGADKQKREYESLYSSNLVLSYRPPADPLANTAPPSYPVTHLDRGASEIFGTAPNTLPVSSHSSSPAAAVQPASTALPASSQPPGPKTYRLMEGTILETVLTYRLDGHFSGPVNCMVTTPVYSHVGRRLLIPAGSRVLGEVKRVEGFGQQRLAVVFHRLIMPDQYSVSLDQFQGLNQVGETGLRDKVNHHYLQIFGVSLAIGAIAGAGQIHAGSGSDRTGTDAYEQGVSASLSQSSLRILDRYLNVLPTFTVREGHRIKIHLSGDLVLPAYGEHPGSAGF